MNKIPLATAVLLSFSPLATFAADTTWISGASTSWATTANWSGGVPPSGGVGAIFVDGSVVRNIDTGSGLQSVQGIQFNFVSGGGGFTIFSTLTPLGLRTQTGGTYVGIVNNDDNTQTISVPVTMANVLGGAGSTASQTFNAAAGGLTFSGIYNGTANTINNNSGRLTIDGAFDTAIGGNGTGRGDIVGTGGLTKNGNGTLFLGGTNANTYSGGTILNAGTIVAQKANALGSSSAQLTLNGGTFNTGGKNQAIGALNLLSSATLDLGAGVSVLAFANSSSLTWTGTLHVLNWTTNVDSLRFGTTSGGLTAAQLGSIVFDDVPGAWPGANQIDGNGFVVPVPEPSTVTLSLIGGFGLAIALRRRNRN